MKCLALLACGLLVACGAGSADGVDTDGGPGDAPPGCVVGISHEVLPPFASPTTIVRAVANVQNSPGQHQYDWFLSFEGGPNQTPMSASIDGSQVEFPATAQGTYRVRFRIEDPNCEEASTNIEVRNPGNQTTVLRVHVVAPPELERPPIDKQVLVEGGATDLIDDLQLAAGVPTTGTVVFAGSPVRAYLKFMPAVGADAVVETYSDFAGGYSTLLRGENHTVLVIPTEQDISPQLVAWSPGQTTLQLAAGVPISGTVLGPQSAPLANATVQVTVDGVPSTTGSTDALGQFSLLVPTATGNVRFEITPPSSVGLPKLVAEATQYTITSGMTVTYAAGLAVTRDLAATVIQRPGTGVLSNAVVTVVGTLPDAGTLTGGLVAVGEVRATALTNDSGVMPTLRVPAAALHAVVFPDATGDHAVTAIDLTASVPATINAAAMVTKATQLTSSTGTALVGAVLDAVPDGPARLAGVHTIRRVAGASGNLTIDLAPGGTYDLRLSDPNGNRGALAVVEDRTTANLAAVNALSKATKVQGTVTGGSAIPGAIVQFLCASCTGIDRSRPVAEGVTGIDGKFSLAVPDPN